MERIAPFALLRADSVGDAVALLAATSGARILAGGTDLMPNLRDGLDAPPALVDIAGIAELSRIEFSQGGTAIGAGVTLAHLAASGEVRRALPVLAEAAAAVAGPGHRSVATLGGNLCLDTRCVFYNQSEWWRRANAYCLKRGGDTCHVAPQGAHCHAAYCGDLAPALLVLDASTEIAGARGVRRIPLGSLYADDGARHLALGHDEIVAAVHIPPQPAGARAGYRKARVRGAIDFPLAGVAARVEMKEGRVAGLRVALTGTNARPVLVEGTDALAGVAMDDALLSALGKLVQKQASPMRTTVIQSNYRRQVAAVLARRLVRELAAK